MDMSEKEKVVLCGSNAYEQKYYFNPEFNNLPEAIKEEIKILCVLFTEDVGGILLFEYEPDGTLRLRVETAEEDILFDEIGCELKIKQLQTEKADLLHGLELYYKVFYLHKELEG